MPALKRRLPLSITADCHRASSMGMLREARPVAASPLSLLRLHAHLPFLKVRRNEKYLKPKELGETH